MHWIRQVVRHLQYALTQELGGREARIFIDEQIEAGQVWPRELQHAAKASKCMIGIWTPEYFRSAWCLSEWKSFEARERHLAGAFDLIAPLKYCDGVHFPAEARRRQWVDVEEYTSNLPAFWDTPDAVKLETELKRFAVQVANRITAAPPFDPEWPAIVEPGQTDPQIGLSKL